MTDSLNLNAIRSEIRLALINQKANACPMAARVAWHSAGTFDASDGTGGTDGATMRFEPEKSDPANAGLSIIRDMLHPVRVKHPELSEADLWGLAGAMAVEFLGGPNIPYTFGRKDDADGARCPAHGRLPDASQGAEHLRSVFGRMGFSDQEIVALSGAHTLGRCHLVRSGFDGPWTSNALKFDNEYFRNLMGLEWQPKEWDGPLQYEDVATRTLMMLPTDMALRNDPAFAAVAQKYADDESAFFADFAAAFGKLLSLGAPVPEAKAPTDIEKQSASFREYAMHGSVDMCKRLAEGADVHAAEPSSGRTALHKAAWWGHVPVACYLLHTCGLKPDVVDFNGDTALHDAARFGHVELSRVLLSSGASASIVNKEGQTPHQTAVEYEKPEVAELLAKAEAEAGAGAAIAEPEPQATEAEEAPAAAAAAAGKFALSDLTTASGEAAATPSGCAVALYFSAHWCPPCKKFTPVLKDMYEEVNAGGSKALEIVFVSSDDDAACQKAYMDEMHGDWLTIKYDSPLRDELKQKYGCFAGKEQENWPAVERKQGIPSLVVISSDGEPVDCGLTGVKAVTEKGPAALKEWPKW
jgi:thiol-disulfide isomerase/thioredoxin